jgi:hypothetical protein
LAASRDVVVVGGLGNTVADGIETVRDRVDAVAHRSSTVDDAS